VIVGRYAGRAVGWLALAAAAYTAALVIRYFVSHGPRFQVESAFFIFVGLGVTAVLLRRDDSGGHALPGRLRHEALLAVAFVAAAFAVYAPAMRIGLLSDDFVIARWAERFELVHLDATGFVRPGAPVFWWILQKLPGDFAAAAHAANVVLHGLNAALVSLVASRIGLPRAEAAAAGAMFAVSAGLSEAVVWASGVQDVLMTTLALAAVALATAERPRIVPAALAGAAALLVKETAIVIPALAALVVLAHGGFQSARRYRNALAVLMVISLVYVGARLAAGMPPSFFEVADWQYFIKQLIASSFATLGAPWTDDWGRTHAVLAIVRAVSILALAAAAFVRWRRGDATFRAAAACAAWVLAGVAPAFSFFYVGPQLEGARYLYLPATGFTILLALLAGLAAARLGVTVRPAAIGLIAGVLAVPCLPAIASDLGRWEAAAAARQSVLARAPEQAARAGCTSFAAEGEADNVSGAYVFRHGLEVALAIPEGGPSVPCRVVMTSGEVVVSRTGR
jgi:hypothetical protein